MLSVALVGNVIGTMTSMRTACLVGSVLMFTGMIVTSASTNVYMVIVFYGFIGGW